MSLQVKFQPNMLRAAFAYLPTRDLFQTPRVCKAWNQVVSDDRFWVRFGDSLKLLTDQEKSSQGKVKQIVLDKLGTICFSEEALKKALTSCLDKLVMDKPCAIQIFAPDAVRDPETQTPIPLSVIVRICNIASENLPSCLWAEHRGIVSQEAFMRQHCEPIKITDLRTCQMNPFNLPACGQPLQTPSTNAETAAPFMLRRRECYNLEDGNLSWFRRKLTSQPVTIAKLEISIDSAFGKDHSTTALDLLKRPVDTLFKDPLNACLKSRNLDLDYGHKVVSCELEKIQTSQAPQSEQKDQPKDS